MNLPNLHIKRTSDAQNKQFDKIYEGLMNYELMHIPKGMSVIPIQTQLVLRDEQHSVYGGLGCMIKWDAIYLSDFWVHERYRRQGLGKRLLKEAEQIGLENHCRFILVETTSFHNMEFYFRNDFKEILKIDDYPKGSCFHILRKDLISL